MSQSIDLANKLNSMKMTMGMEIQFQEAQVNPKGRRLEVKTPYPTFMSEVHFSAELQTVACTRENRNFLILIRFSLDRFIVITSPRPLVSLLNIFSLFQWKLIEQTCWRGLFHGISSRCLVFALPDYDHPYTRNVTFQYYWYCILPLSRKKSLLKSDLFSSYVGIEKFILTCRWDWILSNWI